MPKAKLDKSIIIEVNTIKQMLFFFFDNPDENRKSLRIYKHYKNK